MPPRDKGPTKNQYSTGLSYVAQKPSFLQNFGQPAPAPAPSNGREPLPERPGEGRWAGGSDGEGAGAGGESDDEWGDVYGGGGDEGPQVVVLKEGRHLSEAEIKKERRRAAGLKSESPEPEKEKQAGAKSAPTPAEAKGRAVPKPNTNKRKLVGNAVEGKKDGEATPDGEKKKKKKAKKGLLSFNEEDGE